MRAPALALLAPALLLGALPPARADSGNHRTPLSDDPKSDINGTPPTIFRPSPAGSVHDAGGAVHEPTQVLTTPTVEKFSDPYGRYSNLNLPDAPVGADYGQGSGRGTVTGTGSGGLSSSLTTIPPDEDEPPPPPIRRPAQQAPQKTPAAGITPGANAQRDGAAASGASQAGAGPEAAQSGIKWGSKDGGDKGAGAAASPSDDRSTTKQAVGKAVKDAAAMIEGFKGREGGMGDFSGAGARGAGGMAAAGAGGRAAQGGPRGAADAASLDPAGQLAQSAAIYHDAFAAAGVRPAVGPDGRTVLLRADGSQASPADLAALRARIDREPTLLASDPNMYRTISRERYGQLQNDYQTRPDLKQTSFKDVAMTDDKKDFLWGRDCEPVGGDCNKAAKKAYKKDKPVTADELERIWESVDAEAKEEESKFNKSKLNGAGIGALASALQGMLGLGSRSAPPPTETVYADGAPAAAAVAGASSPTGGGARASAARSRGAAAGEPPSMSLAAALPARTPGRTLAGLLAAAGLLLLVAAARARRA